MSDLIEIPKLWIPSTIKEYEELDAWLFSLKQKGQYSEWEEAMRFYSMNDLFFLHRYVLQLGGAIHSTYGTFLYHDQLYVDACKQYERHITYGSSLDCSSRRSGKSEIRSCTLPIYLALKYPDIAIFFFSVQKDLAQKHLRRVAQELQGNMLLKQLHPDKLWQNPQEETREARIPWSIGDGLCIKGRTLNRSIQTFEAHAMFQGGPVGTGPDCIVFDDCERSDKVATAEAIEDLDSAFSEAVSLLTPVVIPVPIIIISNTRFAEAGLIQRIKDKYEAINPDKVRCYPAEDLSQEGDGPLGGKVNYPYTAKYLRDKYEEQPDKSEYALQYALDYRAANDRKLPAEMIQYYTDPPNTIGREMNVIIGIDPSRGVKDPTAIWVWGIDRYGKKFWLDGFIGKMDPAKPKFWDTVFNICSKWQNLSKGVFQVRVDESPSSSWTEMVQRELSARGLYLNCIRVKARTVSHTRGKFKNLKMEKNYTEWVPMLMKGEVWFPLPSSKGGSGIWCDKDDSGNNRHDIVDYFLNIEFLPFPSCRHDDALDAGGMINNEDINAEFPIPIPGMLNSFGRAKKFVAGASWMSAG